MENRGSFFRPYKSMYVDTKLPEIAQIRRERYDKARSEYDQLQRAVGSIRLLNDGEDSVKNQLLSDIESMVGGGVDFENMGRVISDATTRFMTDTKLMDAMDSKATADKEEEFINTTIAQKGAGSVLDFGKKLKVDPATNKVVIDPLTNMPVREDARQTWNTEQQGIYRFQAEPKLDWDQKMLQWLQGINTDPVLLQKAQGYGLSQDTLNAYLMEGKQVDQTKLENIASFLKDSFSETPEGVQMLRNFTELEMNPATGSTYTPEEAKDKILNHMVNLGRKQVGADYSYMANQLYIARAKAALEATGPVNPLTRVNIGETHPTFKDVDPAIVDDEFVNRVSKGVWNEQTMGADGLPKLDTKSISSSDVTAFEKEVKNAGGLGNLSSEYINNRKEVLGKYILEGEEFKDLIEDYRRRNMSDKDILTTVITGMRSMPEVQERFPTPASNQVLQSEIGREIQNPSSEIILVKDGSPSKVTYKELGKQIAGLDFGTTALDQIQEALQNGSASVTLNVQGPYAGYLTYSGVHDEADNVAGNQVVFHVKMYDQQDRGFSAVRSVYKILNSKNRTKSEKIVSESDRQYIGEAIGKDLSGGDLYVRGEFVGNGANTVFEPILVSRKDGKDTVIEHGSEWVKRLADYSTNAFQAANFGNIVGEMFSPSKQTRSTLYETQ